MDNFARLGQEDKQAYFELAANRKGLSKQIIEKDFWVCWTLKQLFSLQDIGAYLIFKGGTSLSKAYNVIERFSEDIDISIDKNFLGYGHDLDPETAPSNKKQQALIKELSQSCKAFTQSNLINALKKKFQKLLSTADAPWSVEIDVFDSDGQSILFYYPSKKQSPPNKYIRPAVKIELGSRGAGDPTNLCTITPFIEELIPGSLTEASMQIKTLSAERTFWEKATILHMYANWPENKILPERQSRHFFDFYKLLQSEIKDSAIINTELLERVAQHKKIYFRACWANYDHATQGTLCLAPSAEVLKALKNDYRKMEAMFYGSSVPWDRVIHEIKLFEEEFNNQLPGARLKPARC